MGNRSSKLRPCSRARRLAASWDVRWYRVVRGHFTMSSLSRSNSSPANTSQRTGNAKSPNDQIEMQPLRPREIIPDSAGADTTNRPTPARSQLRNAGKETKSDTAVCRYCKDEANSKGRLMTLCRCEGVNEMVHCECVLQKIIRSKRLRCELCKKRFEMPQLHQPQTTNQAPAHTARWKYTFMKVMRIIGAVCECIWISQPPEHRYRQPNARPRPSRR